MAVLVDTNALYALADADDPWHEQVVNYATSTNEILVVPVTVLPEIDYLITRNLGTQASIAVLQEIAAGAFRLEVVTAEDVARAIDVVKQYADSDIGLVDASIVAMAERLNITRIMTRDQHFRMFRPRHHPFFELMP